MVGLHQPVFSRTFLNNSNVPLDVQRGKTWKIEIQNEERGRLILEVFKRKNGRNGGKLQRKIINLFTKFT